VSAPDDPPLPRAVRQRRLALDGPWTVELGPGSEPLPIRVPFPYEAPLSGIGRGAEVHERLRYRTRFTLPPAWKSSRVLLRFGAVDWRAEVSLDGRPVGGHTGGYAHFALDLGTPGGSVHELVVDVEDPAEGPQPRGKQRGSGGIWYTRTTGIWRPVWLEAVPDVHVRAFSVDAAVDGTVDVRVETSAPTGVEVRVGGERARLDAPGSARLRVAAPRLWSPADPVLYDVRIATDGGDEIASYTAFRSLERRGRELLLNGEPVRLCGVLDQGFWPGGVYAAPDGDALRADVEAAKAMGFDLARMHVKVADPRWYGWCDRLGLLVAQDLPSSHDLSTEAARDGFRRETVEIVEQLRGHPCLALWVAVNEDWGEPPPDFQRELVGRIRAADPGRLVVDASGWTQLDDTDLRDVHDYGDDLSAHASAPDLPLWLGECGGVSLAAHGAPEDFAYTRAGSADALAAEYERRVGQLGDVAGFVWTQLTDVEGELNGLLTHDRVPKIDPERIRRANERFRARR
jgi:beta-galactosidase/beta-glucuronidase